MFFFGGGGNGGRGLVRRLREERRVGAVEEGIVGKGGRCGSGERDVLTLLVGGRAVYG